MLLHGKHRIFVIATIMPPRQVQKVVDTNSPAAAHWSRRVPESDANGDCEVAEEGGGAAKTDASSLCARSLADGGGAAA